MLCGSRHEGKIMRIIDPVKGTARADLPASLAREIGRIIVHWSNFEYFVQSMVWQTIQVSEQVGRLAVRDARIADRLEMLRDLIKLRNGTWDDALFKSILERAKVVDAKRNLLAHGIWDVHAGSLLEGDVWYVQVARGSWPKNVKELIEGSKKINPEMMPIRLSNLRETTEGIVQLIEDLKRLRSSAVA
jgi:hypothetical protein